MLSSLYLVGQASKPEEVAPIKIEMTNVLKDGKKVWLPGEAKVKAGARVELVLKNDLMEEHGFQIPGLVDPVVVPPHGTKTVSFDAIGEGQHPFTCHMHPAHVGGTLTITK